MELYQNLALCIPLTWIYFAVLLDKSIKRELYWYRFKSFFVHLFWSALLWIPCWLGLFLVLQHPYIADSVNLARAVVWAFLSIFYVLLLKHFLIDNSLETGEGAIVFILLPMGGVLMLGGVAEGIIYLTS